VRIVTVPCLKDNFAYLIIDGTSAAVVDPSQAGPIEAACQREAVTPTAIWLTHHHWDHVGGVSALRSAHPGIAVVAHAIDAKKIGRDAVTHLVEDRATVSIGSVAAAVIHNPGHTLGAVSFYIGASGNDPGSVFTGDTLFAAGCGRVFEGEPEMMYASLRKLAALPPATQVYFGHEYTATNLAFAMAAEPNHPAIAQRAARLGLPSTPSTIELECATNPFVRAGSAQEFSRLRLWKDGYR
jgi:hydroxyacylglutathione hydrolase